jgi:hypothetical protein
MRDLGRRGTLWVRLPNPIPRCANVLAYLAEKRYSVVV